MESFVDFLTMVLAQVWCEEVYTNNNQSYGKEDAQESDKDDISQRDVGFLLAVAVCHNVLYRK